MNTAKNLKNGYTYTILHIASSTTNGPTEGQKMVVYTRSGDVYVRELEEFLEKFEIIS